MVSMAGGILHQADFSINLGSFYGINIVDLSFSIFTTALSSFMKAYAMKSCKHMSLHRP